MTDHRALAERLAASDYGDGWLDAAAAEAAGWRLVPPEDGR